MTVAVRPLSLTQKTKVPAVMVRVLGEKPFDPTETRTDWDESVGGVGQRPWDGPGPGAGGATGGLLMGAEDRSVRVRVYVPVEAWLKDSAAIS